LTPMAALADGRCTGVAEGNGGARTGAVCDVDRLGGRPVFTPPLSTPPDCQIPLFGHIELRVHCLQPRVLIGPICHAEVAHRLHAFYKKGNLRRGDARDTTAPRSSVRRCRLVAAGVRGGSSHGCRTFIVALLFC